MFILSYTIVEYALTIIIYSTIVYKIKNGEVNKGSDAQWNENSR